MEKNPTPNRGRASTDRTYAKFSYVDTAIGSPSHRNNVVDVDQLNIPTDVPDCYITLFRFGDDCKHLCDATGSVKGAGDLLCWCDHVWIDIDRPDLSAAHVDAKQILVNLDCISPALSKSAAVSFSGAKGFHIGIPSRLFGLEPSMDLPAQIKRIALAIAKDVLIDTHIYDKNRLWRVPNTINGKSGLYKVPLSYDEFATWSIDQIQEKAKSPHGEAKLLLTYEGQYEPIQALVDWAKSVTLPPGRESRLLVTQNGPGWIADALPNLQEGNRNDTFTRITGKLNRDGWSEQDILALLTPHALQVDFPRAELEGLVTGVCARYPRPNSFQVSDTIYTEKHEIRYQPTLLSLSELMAREECEVKWLVEPIFPLESVAIIGGPPGIGKSFMLLDLAIACAAGGLWLNHFPVAKGTVLYVDEESSASLLKRRFGWLLGDKGLPDNQDISISVGTGVSRSKDGMASLRHLLDKVRPSLLVIDSLIRFHRADENSATEMARVFGDVKEIVRETGCLVVFADHHRKPGPWESSPDASLRGSTEKVAFVDCLLSLKRDGKDIVVDHSKSRFDETVERFVVRIEKTPEGNVRVRRIGDHAQLKSEQLASSAKEIMEQTLAKGNWLSRQELVAIAVEKDVKPRAVDEYLKNQIGVTVEREDRSPEGGRGRKQAFYRLLNSFHVSNLYIGKKLEIKSDGVGPGGVVADLGDR